MFCIKMLEIFQMSCCSKLTSLKKNMSLIRIRIIRKLFNRFYSFYLMCKCLYSILIRLSATNIVDYLYLLRICFNRGRLTWNSNASPEFDFLHAMIFSIVWNFPGSLLLYCDGGSNIKTVKTKETSDVF